MDTIRITKSFRFEMAHVLKGYDGPCRNIHGHSYELRVTVKGKPICDTSNPKNGMVMDFGELKTIVNNLIINQYDHAFVMCSAMPNDFIALAQANFDKVIVVDYQPTSEMMLSDFAHAIKTNLPQNIELQQITLRETETSVAEWNKEDN